ncbi:MAG TPA: sigma-70 family RNA polymerase sigma factor [Candidatus Binatia bacterium]|jgi:RNA polymerase sigma-70 factor (ECF subfamily)|nr:sigma-70 family RNA polymerase sigma factor [Candidatus Binatia bacterium]
MNDDRALMARIAARDADAFATLVVRHGARLHAVARRLLPAADAEDAVQRALLQCYLGAATYRPEWAVSTWLYRILTNVCVDELRRSARSRRVDPAPTSQAAPDGTRLDLVRALRTVPREARLLLALRYVDDLPYAELARIRGISVNTVKSQLARGKSILRAALGGGTDGRTR